MKFALVTGASTGIGRSVAVELGRRGFTVGLVARKRDRLLSTARLVREAGGIAHVFVCDLSASALVRSLISRVTSQFSRLDVLVNVAGVWHGPDQAYSGMDFGSFSPQVIMDTYSVGFLAPTLLVHGLLPIMGQGSAIINVSGTFEDGAVGWLPYFASKRALEDFTLGLSAELASSGINVNCISPSDTATDEYLKYFPGESVGANSPEQVAGLIVSVAGDNTTGRFIVIRRGEVHEEFHA